MAGTPIDSVKHWEDTVRPIEGDKIEPILKVEQSLDDREANGGQEDGTPADEQRLWDELANKYEDLQRKVTEQFGDGFEEAIDGPPAA